jgi:hypothetical protein
VVGLGWVAS